MIPPQRDRLRDNTILTEGQAPVPVWRAAAARYGVDLIVAERRLTALPDFAGLRRLDTGPTDRFVVLEAETCG